MGSLYQDNKRIDPKDPGPPFSYLVGVDPRENLPPSAYRGEAHLSGTTLRRRHGGLDQSELLPPAYHTCPTLQDNMYRFMWKRGGHSLAGEANCPSGSRKVSQLLRPGADVRINRPR